MRSRLVPLFWGQVCRTLGMSAWLWPKTPQRRGHAPGISRRRRLLFTRSSHLWKREGFSSLGPQAVDAHLPLNWN